MTYCVVMRISVCWPCRVAFWRANVAAKEANIQIIAVVQYYSFLISRKCRMAFTI